MGCGREAIVAARPRAGELFPARSALLPGMLHAPDFVPDVRCSVRIDLGMAAASAKGCLGEITNTRHRKCRTGDQIVIRSYQYLTKPRKRRAYKSQQIPPSTRKPGLSNYPSQFRRPTKPSILPKGYVSCPGLDLRAKTEAQSTKAAAAQANVNSCRR